MDNNPQTETRERKRAQFSDSQGSKRKVAPILILIVLALLAAGVYLVVSSGGKPTATVVSQTPGASPGSGASDDVRIALTDIGDGHAKFFDYRTADNRQLRFFVMKCSDGVVRAALDACDTCYHAKKGYHQEGDEMVCNNCGLKFHSSLINEVKGGCNPVGLPRSIEGDQLVIKARELESRSSYF